MYHFVDDFKQKKKINRMRIQCVLQCLRGEVRIRYGKQEAEEEKRGNDGMSDGD